MTVNSEATGQQPAVAKQPARPQQTQQRRPFTQLAVFLQAATCALLAAGFGVLAAWPIYQSAGLLVAAVVGFASGICIAGTAVHLRWSGPLTLGVMLGWFVLSVLPVAMPQALNNFPTQVGSGLVDALAAVVTGWNELLTLSMPVGTFHTVLVPVYLVVWLASFGVVWVALRGGRFAPFAALPMLAPMVFGAVFGPVSTSDAFALQLLPAEVFAPATVVVDEPRQLVLWLCALALAGAWVVWVSGAARRKALRLGRLTASGKPDVTREAALSDAPGQPTQAGVLALGRTRASSSHWVRRGNLVRGVSVVAMVVAAMLVAVFVAPVLGGESGRVAPRDSADPALVVQQQASPLAEYRVWKQNDRIDSELFTVSSLGAGVSGGAGADQPDQLAMPERLRLAVLDEYNGVDFHVGSGAANLYTRFPSAGAVDRPAPVEVRIGAGYQAIWAPISALGSVPEFLGPRADALADSLYVNRASNTAVVLAADTGLQQNEFQQTSTKQPESVGLRAGDGYRAVMSAAPLSALESAPSGQNLVSELATSTEQGGGQVTAFAEHLSLRDFPELATWVAAQQQSADAAGFAELVQRLRDRGYLSHSLSEQQGEWINRLGNSYGTVFQPSAGGHSVARVEQLFAQLNLQEATVRQQGAAVTDPQNQAAFVAAIGDDEQFAAAVALMARALGYESRVVLGVRLAQVPGSTDVGVDGIPACEESCTGENLAAWVEVRGETEGWATVDVTPQVRNAPATFEQGDTLPEYPTIVEQRAASEIDPPVSGAERNDENDPAAEPEGEHSLLPLVRSIGLLLLLLLCICLPILAIPVAKRVRVWARKREKNPELSALTAWQTLVEDAVDRGLYVDLAHPTRADLAQRMGGNRASNIADSVDRAVFSSKPITANEAGDIWQQVMAECADRRAQSGVWANVRAMFGVRSYGLTTFANRGIRMGFTHLSTRKRGQGERH